jgi:prepilin-type N-terminal cleavage/methylation domain-containing protein
MRHLRAPRGLTLVEVLVAATILVVGLLGILTAFPTSYLNVVGSGAQSKAVAYARQQMEMLKNQPFTPGPAGPMALTGLAAGYSGTWVIAPVTGTVAPNRLARLTVAVSYNTGGAGRQAQTVTLETLRAE